MRAALTLTILVTLAPCTTRAQSSDGRELLDAAVAEYDAGNYEEAYALFMRMHEQQPTARTQRALGKTAFELRRYRDSVRWLEGALADSRSPLTAEMRGEVESLLQRARAFIGRYEVRADVSGASIEVDGAPIEGNVVELDLGTHEIVARAEGYEPASRRVTVRGGERDTIELSLRALGAAGAGGAAPAPDDPGALYRDLGVVGLIAGGVLAAGGVAATIVWADTVGTLNANLEARACFADPSSEDVIAPSPPVCYDQESRYRLALPLAIAGYAAGAALLAVGFGLIVGAPGGAERASIACGPFGDVGLACQGRF